MTAFFPLTIIQSWHAAGVNCLAYDEAIMAQQDRIQQEVSGDYFNGGDVNIFSKGMGCHMKNIILSLIPRLYIRSVQTVAVMFGKRVSVLQS